MSISDRLDQIASSIEEQESEHGPWHYTEFGVLCSCGNPMTDEKCPDFDYDKAAMLAAVRAVLDACDRIDASIIPSGDFEVGQKSVTQTVRMVVERKLSTVPSAAESARAIATALGKEA